MEWGTHANHCWKYDRTSPESNVFCLEPDIGVFFFPDDEFTNFEHSTLRFALEFWDNRIKYSAAVRLVRRYEIPLRKIIFRYPSCRVLLSSATNLNNFSL